MTTDNYKVCRREIRVSDTELYCQDCGKLFIGHKLTKYCPECIDGHLSACLRAYRKKTLNCICCGEPLETGQVKYCLDCAGLTFKLYQKHFSTCKRDIIITAEYSERNIDRNCPVDKSIDCVNCPLDDCVLEVDE